MSVSFISALNNMLLLLPYDIFKFYYRHNFKAIEKSEHKKKILGMSCSVSTVKQTRTYSTINNEKSEELLDSQFF